MDSTRWAICIQSDDPSLALGERQTIGSRDNSDFHGELTGRQTLVEHCLLLALVSSVH